MSCGIKSRPRWRAHIRVLKRFRPVWALPNLSKDLESVLSVFWGAGAGIILQIHSASLTAAFNGLTGLANVVSGLTGLALRRM